MPTLVRTAQSGSTMFTASSLPPRPTSSTATSLVVAQKMRRSVQAGAISTRPENGLQHCAGGSLAVGAADGDDRAVDAHLHARKHRGDALEAERDGLGVLLLDVAQPLVERSHDRLFS